MEIIADFPKVSADAPPHKQLEYHRNAKGISKAQLGKLIGVPTGEIVNYEKQFQEIYYEKAIKLADVLDMDVNLLLDDYTTFVTKGYGQRIKEIRGALGYSQNKFAELIGVSRCTVSLWEVEYHNHRPSRENYRKIISHIEEKEGEEDDTQRASSILDREASRRGCKI